MKSKKSNNKLIKLLTSETIEEKMNILCAISVIKKDQLHLDIPGGLKGVLPVANISRWISGMEPLNRLFEVGLTIPCQVQHIQPVNDKSIKRQIILSSDPTLINENLSNEHLYIGMYICGSVKSKEEHGYVMDIGISSVRAFLKTTAVQGITEGGLTVGQIIKCNVIYIESNCMQLSYDPTRINNAPAKRKFTFRELSPGQLVTVTVQQVSAAGLIVKHKNIVGAIHKYHLKRRWDKPLNYEIGKKLFAVVLYADPHNKVVHFSLNLELFKYGKSLPGYCIGDVVKNSVLMERKPNYVTLKLNNKFRAKCMRKEWSAEINFIKINSVLKCLVTGINLMDNIVYVSLKDNNFNTKIKNYSDIKVGHIFKATVKEMRNDGFIVKIYSFVTGYIPQSQISDDLCVSYDIGDSIKCRVLSVDDVNQKLILTAKESIVSLKSPIIDSYEQIELKMIMTGTIVKLRPYLILVKFFNNIKGIIGSMELRSFGILNAESICYIGQTIDCIVKTKPENAKPCLSLAIKNFPFPMSRKIVVGKLYQLCKVIRQVNRTYDVRLNDDLTARLPSYHLSDYRNHCTLLESVITVGDDLGPVVGFSNSITNVVSKKQSVLNYFNTDGVPAELKIGAIVPGIILAPVSTGFVVELPGDARGKIRFCEMTAFCEETFEFYEGMSIKCEIIKMDINLQGISLRTHFNKLWHAESKFFINWFKEYLLEKRKIEKDLTRSDDETLSFLAQQVNKKVKFYVTEKQDHMINGYLDSEHQVPATAPNAEEVRVQVGNWVTAFVVNVDLISKRVDLNLLLTNCNQKSALVKVGKTTDAKVIVINSEFAILYLLDGSHVLVYVAIKTHLNDLIDHSSMLILGEVYPVSIIDNEIEGFIIATIAEKSHKKRKLMLQNVESDKKLKSHHEVQTEERLKIHNEDHPKEKLETQKEDQTTEKNSKSSLKRKRTNSVEQPQKKINKSEINKHDTKDKFLDVGTDFEWVDSWETNKMNENEIGDGDIEENENTAKKKKLTKKEEDNFIYLKERELADDSRLPETEDDFDRLVLASPDSSLVWLQYTAFHLQNLQIDKARAVCKRALSIINFREEEERLNVWVALLNLENTYGSEEGFKETIKDAEKNNDLFKINKCVIKILQKDNKTEQAIEIFSSLIKRYKKDERIWIEYMQFLMESQKFDLARTTLTRCESNLTKKQIIDVTSKMGQLEFKLGDTERGRTIFENLIANNPKRTDLWSVFIDLEIKGGFIDQARSLLERAISVKGSAKHMKFLFKKYCEFEKTHGDVKNLKQVKKKAKEYINSQQTD